MRNPGGYAQIIGPGLPGPMPSPGVAALQRHGECDTFTCRHCQTVVHVPPKADAADLGGLCKICMGLVCPRCVGHGCAPWERTFERQLRREALYNAVCR